MTDSTNLHFPYLDGAQAQKHVTVNESLRRLDALVLLAVEDKDLTAPPGCPPTAHATSPTRPPPAHGAARRIYVAHYVDGAWEFYTPREGFLAYVRDEDLVYRLRRLGMGAVRPRTARRGAHLLRAYRRRGQQQRPRQHIGRRFPYDPACHRRRRRTGRAIYDVTIQIANGTYSAAGLMAKSMAGAGSIVIVGDETTPANVVVNANNAGGIGLNATNVKTTYAVRGVKMVLTGGGIGFAIYASGGSLVTFQNLEFNSGWYQQIRADDAARTQGHGQLHDFGKCRRQPHQLRGRRRARAEPHRHAHRNAGVLHGFRHGADRGRGVSRRQHVQRLGDGLALRGQRERRRCAPTAAAPATCPAMPRARPRPEASTPDRFVARVPIRPAFAPGFDFRKGENAMDTMVRYLDGKKTYIAAAVAALIAGAQALGYQVPDYVYAIVGALGLGSLRAAVRKKG